MKTQDMTPGRQGFAPTAAELYEWLDKQLLCTIATLGAEGFPNTATVAFSQTPDMTFVVITAADSRKARNIARDDRVAMTITNESERYTVQLEGYARQLTWDEFAPYEEYHYQKLPFSLPFKDIPGQAPFLITPTRVRFSDVSVRPWLTTEVIERGSRKG